MSDQRLLDRVTVVVGGGRGLGKATCHRYAKEGAIVIVADLDGNGWPDVAAVNERGLELRWWQNLGP